MSQECEREPEPVGSARAHTTLLDAEIKVQSSGRLHRLLLWLNRTERTGSEGEGELAGDNLVPNLSPTHTATVSLFSS